MIKRFAFFAPILLAPLVAAPAAAGVNGFAIVNQTGMALSAIEARRVGSSDWVPLSAAPAAGASAAIAFNDPDCAFDLRGTVAGAGPAVWRGVNLCDVKSVTLNRDKSGRTWVDYD
jgi:hypothetical protein